MATAEQYADWIVKNQDKKGSEQYNTVAQAYKDARGMQDPQAGPQVTPQNEPDFLDNVSTALDKRGEAFGRNISGIVDDIGDNYMIPGATNLSLMEAARRTGGLVAGGINDVIGEGIKSAASYLPESVKDTFTEGVKSIAETDTAKSVGEIYQGFKRRNPQLDQELRDAGNMVGLLGGVALAKPATSTVGGALKAPVSLIPQGPAKQAIAQKLLSGSDDLATTPFQIKSQTGLEKLFNTGVKIESSPSAKEALKQGVDEGVVHSIKASTPATKRKLGEMTEMMEKIRTKNALYGVDKRPGDIAGESLQQRVMIVNAEKVKAGKELNKVALGLKGNTVDISEPFGSFFDGMKGLGVNIGDDLKLGFNNSDIKRMSGARNLLTDITERLAKTKGDAFEVHKLKKFIDDNVIYGKVKSGLSGRSESIVKDLRRNLDGKLDDTFSEYNRVNSTYSETLNGIKALQDVSGKKVDIMGERGSAALGRKLRGIMSNNISRDTLIKASQDIEDLAKKYGGKFDDNISMQVLFADELDSLFKPAARTGFQGQIGQALDRTARAARSPMDAGVTAAGVAIDKVRGVNQAGAFKSLKELLKETN